MDAMLRQALWQIVRPLLHLISNLVNPEIGEEWTHEFGKFIAKRPCWMPVEPKQEVLPLDPIVRVDPSIKPSYPSWVKEPLHPELELTGPAEFDASMLELWLHEKQRTGRIQGHDLYKYLEDNEKMLESCLGLTDLLAIQAKGIAFFRKHFAGKAIFGWKSAVQYAGGRRFVPCLCEVGGEVVLCWYWLDDVWYSGCPALRFAKQLRS